LIDSLLSQLILTTQNSQTQSTDFPLKPFFLPKFHNCTVYISCNSVTIFHQQKSPELANTKQINMTDNRSDGHQSKQTQVYLLGK